MLILGIETSCDETAAAVVARDGPARGCILSNVVRSQLAEHRPYGGVVPEIAARAHVECLDTLLGAALSEAGVSLFDLSGVAATAGPGLNSGLVVGLVTGKTLALAADKPFLAINHLEAHALTVGLTDGVPPPYLLLLVSGGHTQTLLVEGVGRYRRIGTTIDDAIGEAFDKTAKLLGLGYPGGPEVERAAQRGDAKRFPLPRPMLGRAEPHFSLAGLKTALRQRAEAIAPLSDKDVADLCAAFEAAVCDIVIDRLSRAMDLSESAFEHGAPRVLTVAGGVAANKSIAAALARLAHARGFALAVPPAALCTDNAAMIAWAGAERLARGLVDGLDFAPKPRWPLDPEAPAAIGAGVKA
ncbi:tRNA (adenosine(37)-N6)-threonylcarbamoyltransferase complex transferase subunit TsaD [Hyphomicrobium sp. CS1GBMeth3]|uniref:tRNA (adenosine(37)-N6)-threonylcarbamoyltransferase complex transferase subunit TsaD n=1 Tax=Hyphomicrobium sp. CS1GBMeth3 TaxID=1892845 RepID=UPI0009300719|nr:tRNA (adenosine(37)-N6)-threonylcarbamoyltransferase complex transferase subunit TsaD [Hyphomicrobium sp. CS1GBMeth3]